VAEVTGEHPAFGSVRSALPTVMAESYSDREIVAAPNKLAQLARLTRAEHVVDPPADSGTVMNWLATITGQSGVALPARVKTVKDYFWAFDRPWIWLLLLFLPLEVIVRRWPQLMVEKRPIKGL
jgi:hypothetical protein